MEKTTWKDPQNGRMYTVYEDGEARMILGPPEELVAFLGLPEPFATNLHNALQRRGVLTYTDATRGQDLIGALQEALLVDAQRLTEAFYHLERQEVLP